MFGRFGSRKLMSSVSCVPDPPIYLEMSGHFRGASRWQTPWKQAKNNSSRIATSISLRSRNGQRDVGLKKKKKKTKMDKKNKKKEGRCYMNFLAT